MRKVNAVIGQNVISLADGHRIASVKDVVIGDGNEHVAALVVQEAGSCPTPASCPSRPSTATVATPS